MIQCSLVRGHLGHCVLVLDHLVALFYFLFECHLNHILHVFKLALKAFEFYVALFDCLLVIRVLVDEFVFFDLRSLELLSKLLSEQFKLLAVLDALLELVGQLLALLLLEFLTF